jgi:hypothetical protein
LAHKTTLQVMSHNLCVTAEPFFYFRFITGNFQTSRENLYYDPKYQKDRMCLFRLTLNPVFIKKTLVKFLHYGTGGDPISPKVFRQKIWRYWQTRRYGDKNKFLCSKMKNRVGVQNDVIYWILQGELSYPSKAIK